MEKDMNVKYEEHSNESTTKLRHLIGYIDVGDHLKILATDSLLKKYQCIKTYLIWKFSSIYKRSLSEIAVKCFKDKNVTNMQKNHF